MTGFKDYLESKGFARATIKSYVREFHRLADWAFEKGKTLEELRYQDLLELIRHCRQQGRNKQQLNSVLRAARLYYNQLAEEGRTTENPVIGLYVKGGTRRLPHDLLEAEDLEKLYNEFGAAWKAFDAKSRRNRILLGLLVFQGLNIEEIEALEPGHLKLREGKLQVPGAPRRNGRTLALEAHQILELQEYLSEDRNQLLKEMDGYSRHPTRQGFPEKKILEISQLFFGVTGSLKLGQIVIQMTYKLRKQYPQYGQLTALKIRESVIAHWLKTKDIRIVQYMSGHKYASSTERYRDTRLEDLAEALKQFHPLG